MEYSLQKQKHFVFLVMRNWSDHFCDSIIMVCSNRGIQTLKNEV